MKLYARILNYNTLKYTHYNMDVKYLKLKRLFVFSYRSATYYNECNNGGSHIGSPNVYTG